MENVQVNRRRVGVMVNQEGGAEIVLWAPEMTRVSIFVAHRNERIPLNKIEFGYWHTVTDHLQHGDLYQFILDNGKMMPDPASLSQPQGVHGPSQAIDLSRFRWEDDTWQNIDLEQYILYELHTGTFSDDGNFEAIEKKIDYLKDLGVNAIEIMPVAQFPGNRNWGYDGVFPYAVQYSYGGAAGLQQLVNCCHQRGIAVVLDVVYNHFGPEGNYLPEFGPYFTGKYTTPWGDAINFDDAWCDGVRHYFIENVLMWFRDFHIDALRLDAVHAIKDFSPVHILREIKQYTNRLMELTGRRHYLISELDLNDNRFINPLEKQGYGMDSQWIDEFHHALRVAAGGERHGYYLDFNGVNHLAKSYRDAYVYDGQFSAHRRKLFGIKADKNPGKQFIIFSQNHDQVGNRMLGERTSKLVSFDMQKLMAAAVMVAPYIPMLFMGEEWSEPAPFLYFVSHGDPTIAEAVRKGRQEEFAAFQTTGEAPDPSDEKVFDQSKLHWHLLSEQPHKTMFDYYKELIWLRKTNAVLRYPERMELDVDSNEKDQTLMLHRWRAEQHILCILNFSRDLQKVMLPGYVKYWKKLFDSAEPRWNGPAAAPGIITGLAELQLQPESFVMYIS